MQQLRERNPLTLQLHWTYLTAEVGYSPNLFGASKRENPLLEMHQRRKVGSLDHSQHQTTLTHLPLRDSPRF